MVASTQIELKSERTIMFIEKQEDYIVSSLKCQQGYKNILRLPLLERIRGFINSEINTNQYNTFKPIADYI